jgi:predicted dehydrogenase
MFNGFNESRKKMKVKILGAGSIGNHLAHASRQMGWSVDICDVDPAALDRTRNMIYPSRYGKWDEKIRLFNSKEATKGGYDLIFIGTPPDVHMSLALEALDEKPRAILIEKPVCGPSLELADEFYKKSEKLGIPSFVGYDHVVGKASRMASSTANIGGLGEVLTLDVEFREHWGGIFGAHPWLSGPEDSYLGFSDRGGGASSEHSHAANLWQHLASEIGAGRIIEVQAVLDFVEDARVKYDRLCIMNFRTESGLIGRCVQDVVTHPPRKWARIQCVNGHVELQVGKEPGVDMVSSILPGRIQQDQRISKTRPDDFIEELTHIQSALSSDPKKSPIHIKNGLDTALVISAAHLSSKTGRRVMIDYSQGYSTKALKTL